MSYRHVILLNEQEQEMYQQIMELKGYRKQELFRTLLKESHRKLFPNYLKGKEEPKGVLDKLSNEKYCTDVLGGEVVGNMCVIKRENGSSTEIPLHAVKEEVV